MELKDLYVGMKVVVKENMMGITFKETEPNYATMPKFEGKIVTIKEINEVDFHIEEDGAENWFWDINLVRPLSPKSLLKDGMVVTYKCGYVRTVKDNGFFDGEIKRMKIEEYNDDLTFSGDSTLDVVKVVIPENVIPEVIIPEELVPEKLIYEYVAAVKVTQAEVDEKFGYKVEVVD